MEETQVTICQVSEEKGRKTSLGLVSSASAMMSAHVQRRSFTEVSKEQSEIQAGTGKLDLRTQK